MRWYSVDVETANSDQSTICQIGVGIFEDRELIDTWKSYVDPEDYFHWRNIRIHGITEEDVQGQPIFPDVYPVLRQMFKNNIVVHHSHFDRTAFRKVFKRYRLGKGLVNYIPYHSPPIALFAFCSLFQFAGSSIDRSSFFLK